MESWPRRKEYDPKRPTSSHLMTQRARYIRTYIYTCMHSFSSPYKVLDLLEHVPRAEPPPSLAGPGHQPVTAAHYGLSSGQSSTAGSDTVPDRRHRLGVPALPDPFPARCRRRRHGPTGAHTARPPTTASSGDDVDHRRRQQEAVAWQRPRTIRPPHRRRDHRRRRGTQLALGKAQRDPQAWCRRPSKPLSEVTQEVRTKKDGDGGQEEGKRRESAVVARDFDGWGRGGGEGGGRGLYMVHQSSHFSHFLQLLSPVVIVITARRRSVVTSFLPSRSGRDLGAPSRLFGHSLSDTL